MIDIIIDIETLGTRPGCPIIEIGAVAMDHCGRFLGNFSRRVLARTTFLDTAHAAAATGAFALSEDYERTCRWWHGDPARREVLRAILAPGAAPVHVGLWQFAEWMGFQVLGHTPETVRVWANGPSFDIAILSHACLSHHVPRPWIYWQERCVRTALEQRGYVRGSLEWAENGPRHRALNDARHEARKLLACGALSRGKGEV